MTNNEVVRNFWNHKVGKSLNMKSTGDKLFSYKTCVAEWRGQTLYVNTTKYSRTTSKQTCELFVFASGYKRNHGKVEYVDCGEFNIASVYGAWLDLVKPKRCKSQKAFEEFKESLNRFINLMGGLVVLSPKTIDMLKDMRTSIRPNNYKHQKMVFENVKKGFNIKYNERERWQKRCVASEFALY